MDTVDNYMTYLGKTIKPITISHTRRATQSWWHHGRVCHLPSKHRVSSIFFVPLLPGGNSNDAGNLDMKLWLQNLLGIDSLLWLLDLGQYNSKIFQGYLERLRLYRLVAYKERSEPSHLEQLPSNASGKKYRFCHHLEAKVKKLMHRPFCVAPLQFSDL